MKEYFYLETKELDNSKKWKGYLLFIIVWSIAFFAPESKGGRDYYIIGMYAIMIMVMVTYGYRDISNFIHRKYPIKNNIYLGIATCVIGGTVSVAVAFLLRAENPQNLVAGQMSTYEYLRILNRLILLPFAEEFFKFMLLFSIYRLVSKICRNKQKGAWGSILATALIFGAMHMNYNYSKGLVIMLSLGLGAMVYLFVLLKYKCIMPLIIAHFIQDFCALTKMWEHGEAIVNMITLACYVGIIYIMIKKSIK